MNVIISNERQAELVTPGENQQTGYEPLLIYYIVLFNIITII